MREIKFRVWDKRKGRMRFGNDNLLIGLGGLLFWDVGYKEPDMLGEEERQDYELMQYTGLNDKNGVEIYEGDIVVVDFCDIPDDNPLHHTGAVEWDVINAAWSISDYDFMFNYYEALEVVGNIHESPELLE